MSERNIEQGNTLSEEEKRFLGKEARHGDIGAAIDAAAEGGIPLSTEEIVEILRQPLTENPANDSPDTNPTK